MQLLVAFDDYCFQKVKLLFTILGQSCLLKFTSQDELTKVDPSAKGMCLDTGSGLVSQHHAIMRAIAKHFNGEWLLGEGAVDSAKNDQWLEFCWQEIECPVFAFMSMAEGGDRDAVRLGIAKALAAMNEHLSSSTFFAGETLALCDISLFVCWLQILELKLFQSGSYLSVDRWARAIASLPSLKGAISSHQSELLSAKAPIGKWDRHRIRVKELLQRGHEYLDKDVTLKGWVRTSRSAEKGALLFVELTDGSLVKGIQLVFDMAQTAGASDVAAAGGVGACIAVEGSVAVSPAKGQSIEIRVKHAKVLGAVYGGENGEVGAKNYPMAKKQHTLEFLREKAHLRPRSKVFSAAMRIRHAMAFATHKFFNDRGFVYVHTPLITAADCEGAGEQFVVTTLLPEHAKANQLPVAKDSSIDFSKDFFGRRCCLTVSGQLNVETHACALSDVYTFGPTFRAENSHTARHLAEFWMIEPEICFADLFDNMMLAEDYVKFCTSYALENCSDDLHYFEHEYPAGEKGLKDRLVNVVENNFVRITYTEAIDLLQKDIADGKVKFSVYPRWGDDLGSEHERYITEKVFKKPTIVINYPKGIKAFYMKLNDDKETVAAMDILVPKIGELIGGSQREEDLATLEQRCVEMGMSPKDIWWYSDLRRYGTVPHAGFGLGFERLVMFITGLENIRDVIPFPRVPGHAEF